MQIDRIVLAATDVDAMAAFYNAVFDSGLTPIGDGPFQAGTFLGFDLLVCPNDIAGVDARQNRHQFRIAVADPRAVLALVEANGGKVIDEWDDETASAGFADPDANTYELTV